MDGAPSRRLSADELAAVGRANADAELRALEVAIFVEEVLDVALPDGVLNPEHLGTPDAVRRLVDSLGRET